MLSLLLGFVVRAVIFPLRGHFASSKVAALHPPKWSLCLDSSRWICSCWVVLVLCRWVVQLTHLVEICVGVGGLSRSTCVCPAFLIVAPLVNYRATLFLDLGRLINAVTVDTPRIFDCGVRDMLRSAATCSA